MVTYNREYIIAKVIDYFKGQGFKSEEYSDRWRGEVRIPLFFEKCWRRENGEDYRTEVVVDIIAEPTVSKDEYLPVLKVEGMTIDYACPPKFFQCYLPRAKVYWAYGATISKDTEYEHFVRACRENGIGLIEVSDAGAKIVEDAKSLLEDFEKKSEESIVNASASLEDSQKRVDESKDMLLTQSDLITRLRLVNDTFCEEYIRRLVYYGDPIFRRREIAGSALRNLSLLLIDKLHGLNNLRYRDVLINLADGYRTETREDYQIALDTTQALWNSRFQMDYPEAPKNFEAVLQLKPNYRDHFLHEFQVFLLGAVVIDLLYNTSPVRSFEEVSGSAIEDAWLAASTYHDFNYAVQESQDWMKEFFTQFLQTKQNVPVSLNLEGVVVRDDFLSKLRDICATLNYSLDDCMVRFIFEKVVIERNHGVLAALSLLNRFNNCNVLTKPATNQAALAILLHDERNWKAFSGRRDCAEPWEISFAKNPILTKLSFSSLPLAFLLAYCDTVQEWGRVGGNYETSKPELADITATTQKILVSVLVEDHTSFTDKRKEMQRLKRFLEDRRFGMEVQSRAGERKRLWMTGR